MFFLTDFRAHLQQKRWFGITYIGINESEMNETLAAIRMVKKNIRRTGRSPTPANWHKELDGLLDDYSFLYGNEPGPKRAEDARSPGGLLSTFYVLLQSCQTE